MVSQKSLRRLGGGNGIALILAVIFTIVFYWLTSRQYLTFQVRAPDLPRFDQAIWNTLHGRFLYTTISRASILGNHFTPYMALLSPLLLIWADVRILFLAQLIGIATTGLILYKIVRHKHPSLAPWFLLAFYLNPILHRVALYELRRVTLAMPFLALALYGLYAKKRTLLIVGIALALLCKEDMGILVSMMGFFLLFFDRDWKWGVPIFLFGLIWTASMLLWVIPAFRFGFYPQVAYFAGWGDSISEILANMLADPLRVLQTMFDQQSFVALWRGLMPLALILPFLGIDYLLISIPLVGLMLMSSEPAMHSLQRWYMAPILPVLFAAVAVGLGRMSERQARWLAAALVITSLIGYGLYSPAPFGRKFDPKLYQITDRHRRVWEVIDAIPEGAIVAAQDAFLPHVTHREQVFLYPWISIGIENVEYFVFGRDFNAYPIPGHEIGFEINNIVAEPNNVVEMEVDGIYLIHQGGLPLPSFPVNRVAEDSIKLERIELAVADEDGYFRPVEQQPVELSPGQEVRVTLYWEALASPNEERTVSVRIADATGALVAQHDMVPGDGARPTSWWEPSWKFKDVYYLTIAEQVTPGPASLDLLLYDTYSQERVAFSGGEDTLHLLQVSLAE